MFAKFLLLLKFFPWVHAYVGLTVYIIIYVEFCLFAANWLSKVSVTDGNLCKEKYFLLLILTVIASIGQPID